MRRALVALVLIGCGRLDFDVLADAGIPISFDELNSSFDEDDATLTGDTLYITTRSVRTDPWGPAAPMSEHSTNFGESGPWLTPDMRVLVFGSNRAGSDDLYIVYR